MSLIDTGVRSPKLAGGEDALAKDQNGKTVVVEPTEDAVDYHGWDTVFVVAEAKYDAGKIAQPGPPPIVDVSREECAAALSKNERTQVGC